MLVWYHKTHMARGIPESWKEPVAAEHSKGGSAPERTSIKSPSQDAAPEVQWGSWNEMVQDLSAKQGEGHQTEQKSVQRHKMPTYEADEVMLMKRKQRQSVETISEEVSMDQATKEVATGSADTSGAISEKNTPQSVRMVEVHGSESASTDADTRSWEVAKRDTDSLMRSADRIVAMTRARREEHGRSHAEAKETSENYAHARSEVTKIKNRLRKITEGNDTPAIRAEIAQLRSSLAKHLHELRTDMPKKSTAEFIDETKQSLGTLAAADAEWLHAQPEYEQVTQATKKLAELGSGEEGDEAVAETEKAVAAKRNPKTVAALRQLRTNYIREKLAVLKSRTEESPADALGHNIQDIVARIEAALQNQGAYDRDKKTQTSLDPLVELKHRASRLEADVQRLDATGASSSQVAALSSTVAEFADEVRKTIDRVGEPAESASAETDSAAVPRVLGLTVPTAGASADTIAAFKDELNIAWIPVLTAAAVNQEASVQLLAQHFRDLFSKLDALTDAEALSEKDAEHVALLAEKIGTPEAIVGVYVPPVPLSPERTTNEEKKAVAEIVEASAVPATVVETTEVTYTNALVPVLPAYVDMEVEKKDKSARRRMMSLGALALVGVLAANDTATDDPQVVRGETLHTNTTEALAAAPSQADEALKKMYTTAPISEAPQWPTYDAQTADDETHNESSNQPLAAEVRVAPDLPAPTVAHERGALSESIDRIPVPYTFRGELNTQGNVIDTVSEAVLYKWEINKHLIHAEISRTKFLATMWQVLEELEGNPQLEARLTAQMSIRSGDIDEVFRGPQHAINLAPFYKLIESRL